MSPTAACTADFHYPPSFSDIRPDGSINYYTWGSTGDSIGDYGRLAQLYVKAVSYCEAPASWQLRHGPAVERMAQYMLELWQAAVDPKSAPPPGCT